MPNESEQRALSQIRDFLEAGHTLDALRQSGWADWIAHLQTKGYDLRTGRLAVAPPEDEPPAIQPASTYKPTDAADIAQPKAPPPGARPRNVSPEERELATAADSRPQQNGEKAMRLGSRRRPWFLNRWLIAAGIVGGLFVGFVVFGAILTLVDEGEQEWTGFSSSAGDFSILFPGAPTTNRQTEVTEFGDIDFTQYGVTLENGSSYLAMYADMPSAIFNVYSTDEMLDAVAPRVALNSSGQLITDLKIEIDSFPGRELKFRLQDGTVFRMRVFVVGMRQFQLAVTAPREDQFAADHLKFFESFSLTSR